MFPFHVFYEENEWIKNADKVSNIPLGERVRTRIKQFSLMNKFKKRVLRVSSVKLTLSQGFNYFRCKENFQHSSKFISLKHKLYLLFAILVLNLSLQLMI